MDISADGVLTIQSLTVPSAPAQTFYYFDDGSFGTRPAPPPWSSTVVEDNGETYLWQKAYAFLPGLTVLPTSNYVVQEGGARPALRRRPGRLGQVEFHQRPASE